MPATADYGSIISTPVKYGTLELNHIQALETGTGDAAVDVALTSPGSSIAAGATGHPSTGVYNFTFPKGMTVAIPIAAYVDAAAATAATQFICAFRNLNVTAGTGVIVLMDAITGALEDLADNQRLYITFLTGSF